MQHKIDFQFEPEKILPVEAKTGDKKVIEVLAVSFYNYGKDISGSNSGLSGQVTKCKVDGIIFYTRETTNAMPSFLMSSGERWGDKIGHKPSKHRQALELLAPADKWHEIAALVKEVDGLKRPVYANKLFNTAWAEKQF